MEHVEGNDNEHYLDSCFYVNASGYCIWLELNFFEGTRDSYVLNNPMKYVDPARYGFGALRTEDLQRNHRGHMHLQNTYPGRIEPRIIPGQR